MKTRWLSRAMAVACFLAHALFTRSAAADAPKVWFVAEQPTPFSARVRAEIETMGFEIVPADAFSETGGPATVAAARVIESPAPRRVELWIMSSASGHLELRAVVQPSLDDDDATQTVRASEQLRAFFQPLRESLPAPALALSPTPPPTPKAPAPIAPAIPAPLVPLPPRVEPRRRFIAGAAIALPIEPGGAGFDILLQGRYMATRRFGVGALVAIPLIGSTLQSGNASANFYAGLLGAKLSAVVLDADALRVTGSAGIAGVLLRATGAATAPYSGKTDSLLAALPMVGLEIAPRLVGRLRLCLGADLGVSFPKTDIAFAGSKVATWGRPLALLFAGVTVDL